MHLVGFTVEIYYDARPYERQISRKYVMLTSLQVLFDSLLTTIQPYIMCETAGVIKPSKNKQKKNHKLSLPESAFTADPLQNQPPVIRAGKLAHHCEGQYGDNNREASERPLQRHMSPTH